MIKKNLLCFRTLKATPKMMRIATKDIPREQTASNYWGSYTKVARQYDLFMRCMVQDGILKVSMFLPKALRLGARNPAFDLFIDRDARRFLTYGYENKKWLTGKLDRIDWGSDYKTLMQRWISPSDAKIVKEYLGTEKGTYWDILNYQQGIRREELMRRHKKETDPWDADMALTPALPKDWDRWVDKVGIPENYIFYVYKKGGAKQGYCSYCGKDVPIQGIPRHNQKGRCVCCRHEITYKAVGRLGYHLDTSEVCVYLLQSRPDGFIVREFWASRRYVNRDYKNPKVSCAEHWRTIYDPQMERRFYHWGNYKQCNMRWISGCPSYTWIGYNNIYFSHGGNPGRVYGKTLPHLAKTKLKQTGLAAWIQEHDMVAIPDKYLAIWHDVPQFEQIWKADLPQLMEECLKDSSSVRDIIKAPQESSLTKALGLDKQGLARLRRYNGGCFLLRWLQVEKESGKAISDEVLQWFSDQMIEATDLNFIWGKMNVLQVYNYLRRQAKECKESARQVLTTWSDYISMAERLGIDTSDEIIYRVNKLRQRHDELVVRCHQEDDKIRAAEVLKDHPEVDSICQSIKEKYEYAGKKYAVVAPSGALDIIVEGNVLHHCVSSNERYWERIERHETYILFLRKTSAPDVPYYTLEIEPDGTVRQKRTKFDRQGTDIDKAMKFLMEWQQVIAKRLTAGDRKKAADSRVLREQEFDQMRKDDVRIRVGDLAGQRLIDVLTADLMENAA